MGRPLGIDWDAQPLGEMTDTDLARRLGCCRSAVSQARERRGIPRYEPRPAVDWDAQPLGMETDGAIAARLGVSESAVSAARRARGIPRLPRREAKPRGQGLWSWVRWEDYPLGIVTDAEVARMAGVCRSAATRARKRRHMPAPPPRRAVCPCGRVFAARTDGVYCSATCQQAIADHRHRGGGPEVEPIVAALARLRSEIRGLRGQVSRVAREARQEGDQR